MKAALWALLFEKAYATMHDQGPQEDGVGSEDARDTSERDVPAHTRMFSRWPVTVASVIVAAIIGLVVGVGIPEFQQGFDGYDARR